MTKFLISLTLNILAVFKIDIFNTFTTKNAFNLILHIKMLKERQTSVPHWKARSERSRLTEQTNIK